MVETDLPSLFGPCQQLRARAVQGWLRRSPTVPLFGADRNSGDELTAQTSSFL